MRYSDIKETVIAQLKAPQGNRVIHYIEGAPGGGKSACAMDIAKELGFNGEKYPLPFQFFASLRDSVDIAGTPRNDGEVTRWVPPVEFHRMQKGPQFLIVEELSDANTAVQNAMCGVFHDRKINDLHLSPELRIIATGNRTKDKSGASRLVSKMANRVRRIEYQENIDDWSDWALGQNIDVAIIQFLRFKPNLLSDFQPDRFENPTPRAWEKVSLIPTTLSTGLYFESVKGDVGEGAAAEYTGFRRIMDGLTSIDSILMNPAKAEVPKDPAILYALTGAIAHKSSKDNFDRVCEYIDRLAPEFQVMCVGDAAKLKPEVKNTKAFLKWAVVNANVLV